VSAQNDGISWWQDDPDRLTAELEAMERAAPDLRWDDTINSGGWIGSVPLWPFERQQPDGLGALVGGQPLEVRITCGPAYPMVMPNVTPLNVDIPPLALGWVDWHVLPSGDLCLLQDAATWDPRGSIGDLVPKISGWYIEFHLMQAGKLEQMTPAGIANEPTLDSLIVPEDPGAG
jgi:hypothetical protein